jgi:hypothetical protein
MKRIILLILLVILVPGFSHSRTWYIKDDGTGDAPTISAGIDSCAVGDTVLVASGTYSPTSYIYIGGDAADSIYVISESGPSTTIIDCSSAMVGFAIEGRYNKFLQLSGFDILNASGGGIDINLSTDGTIIIENSIIHGNSGYGIGMSQSGEVTIRGNLIYSNLKGIGCIESDGVEIIENTIAFHSGTQAYGIYLDSAFLGNTVRNNVICYNDAILGVTQDNATFECNNIFNNTVNLDSYIGVDGNFAEDPQFCSITPEADGNFYLQSDSPCMPGNHPDGDACGLIGSRPNGCGVTGTEERSWGKIKKLMKPSSNSR